MDKSETKPDETWPALTAEAAALQALSDELASEFHVERALLPSGVAERVMMNLPRETSPLLRCARALTGAILLAATGCVALAALTITSASGADAAAVLRAVTGVSASVVAVLLSFAAPKLVLWDAELMKRITGRITVPGPADIVVVRLGALLLLLAGGALMLP